MADAYQQILKHTYTYMGLKSDDHLDSYLGNRILHDRAKGSVTVSQEQDSMACLERFGLAYCIENNKPITSRLTSGQGSTSSSQYCR